MLPKDHSGASVAFQTQAGKPCRTQLQCPGREEKRNINPTVPSPLHSLGVPPTPAPEILRPVCLPTWAIYFRQVIVPPCLDKSSPGLMGPCPEGAQSAWGMERDQTMKK